MNESDDEAFLEHALAVAEGLAREAGEVLLDFAPRIVRGEARTKSSARDLVTAADLASERAIVAGLRAAFPTHAIEAEEETRDAARPGPRWFVDPLDGTTNYFHGLFAYAVSIALYDGERPLVGVVHAPRLGETYLARAGGGAQVASAAGRSAMRVSRAESLAGALLASGFPYERDGSPRDNVEHFAGFVREVRDLRRIGSAALDLAWTAAGRLDAYWEFGLAPHDVAAGALLVREAGGRVGDAGGAATGWLRGGAIVAGAPALVPLIAARLGA